MPHSSSKQLKTDEIAHPRSQEFSERVNVSFRNLNLLNEALTHRSFANEVDADDIRDNERLEFLGDTVLDLVVTDMLYVRFPDVSEGELTRLRAALVRNESLAELASDCDLGNYLLMGKGEESSGGRSRKSNLCRGFEAVIGAIYLDRGLEAVKQFVLPRMEDLLAYILEHGLHRDARSELQEMSQAELSITPSYRVIGADGPDHEKKYTIEVIIGDNILGHGIGKSKRTAAQAAARTALQNLIDGGWDELDDDSEESG